MKKILIINIILILSIFVLIEYSIFNIMSKKERNDREYPRNFLSAYTFLPIKSFKQWYKELAEQNFNEEQTKSKISQYYIPFNDYYNNTPQKPPILFIGCSYTYGGDIKFHERLSTKIGEQTKRNTYNRGIPGTGIQQSLYMIKSGLINSLPQKPEYVIYTYFSDHIRRLHKECSFFEHKLIFYKNQNNELIELKDKDLLYWHSYLTRYIHQKITEKELKNEEKNKQLMLLYLKEINKEIKKSSKETKLIVFEYTNTNDLIQIKEELEKENIKLITLNEISDINVNESKYICDDVGHPSALVWEIVSPKLIKILNL